MTKRVFILSHDQAKQGAMAHLAALPSDSGLMVTFAEKTRTAEQNARYWSKGVLWQIAEQATVAGRKFSSEAWHEQFKRQFIGIVELPNGSVVGESSTGLSVKKFGAFVEQVEAFAVTELGVVFEDERAYE